MSVTTGRTRSFIFISLGVLISAIGVALIAPFIDREQMAQAFTTLVWPWIGAAIAAVVITYLTRLPRWALLLRPETFRFTVLLRALLSGQLLNLLLPIRIGDAARALLLSREPGGSFARILGSVLIEKAWDWLALCLLILLCVGGAQVAAIPLPDWFLIPARSVGFVAALILLGFVTVALTPTAWLPRLSAWFDRVLRMFPTRWQAPVGRSIRRLIASLGALRQRQSIIGAAGWTLIIWGGGVIINYAVLRAYNVDSWLAAITLLAVLMLGLALPPSIAGIGVFEGLTLLTLYAFAVPLNSALAIGVTLHGVIIITLFISTGLAWLATAVQPS